MLVVRFGSGSLANTLSLRMFGRAFEKELSTVNFRVSNVDHRKT